MKPCKPFLKGRTNPLRGSFAMALCFISSFAFAQLLPESDFFNQGVIHFLKGSPEAAKAVVESGLSAYPESENLKKLQELLQQPPPQDASDAPNQKESDSGQQSEAQPEKPSDGDSGASDTQKQQQEQQKETPSGEDSSEASENDQTKPDESAKTPESASSSPPETSPESKPAGSADASSPEDSSLPPDGMTPQEAIGLLESERDNERRLPLHLLRGGESGTRQKPSSSKDW